MTRVEIEAILDCDIIIDEFIGDPPDVDGIKAMVRLFNEANDSSNKWIICVIGSPDLSSYDRPSDELCNLVYNIVNIQLIRNGFVFGPLTDTSRNWATTAIVGEDLINGA